MEKVIRLNNGCLCCEPRNIYVSTEQSILDSNNISVENGMTKPDFVEFGYSFNEEEYFINLVYDPEGNEREYAIELQKDLPPMEITINPRLNTNDIIDIILEDMATGNIKISKNLDEIISIKFSHEKCTFELLIPSNMLPEFEEL